MLKICFSLLNIQTSNVEYGTIEEFCKRLIQDDKSFFQKIEALDDTILLCEADRENISIWIEKIHEAKKNNSIPQVQSQIREHFIDYFPENPGSKSRHLFVYGTDSTPLPEILVRNPIIIDEICDQIQKIIDKTYLFKMQILEPLSTAEPTTTVQVVQMERPQAVRNERVQWHGKTVDFFRLLKHLEDKRLIDTGLRPTISLGFLDKNGNPMPGNKTSYLSQAKEDSIDPETKHLIEELGINRDKDLS